MGIKCSNTWNLLRSVLGIQFMAVKHKGGEVGVYVFNGCHSEGPRICLNNVYRKKQRKIRAASEITKYKANGNFYY